MAQPVSLEPTSEEVVRAVRSLYEDEIRPFGRILMKRIREQAAPPGGDAEAVPLLDPRHLRRVCEACPSLRVELAEGREFVARLVGQAGCFVDACSLLDPYPARLWEEAAAYFDGLDVATESLPCGRYACAAELVRRALPFLAGRSLGEVCHIVQVAISAKKLLGHAGGRVVPYSSSDENARARGLGPCEGRGALAGRALARRVLAGAHRQRAGSGALGCARAADVRKLVRADGPAPASPALLEHLRLDPAALLGGACGCRLAHVGLARACATKLLHTCGLVAHAGRPGRRCVERAVGRKHRACHLRQRDGLRVFLGG